MQDYELRLVAGTLRVELLPGPGIIPAGLEPRIAAAWEAAQARAGGRLFNGQVFSVVESSRGTLAGRFVEYRQVVAGFADPALAAALAIRPLSVCGVLRLADGVVFGRRSAAATYEAGLWQMPPAGSVDAGAARGAWVDAEAAIRAELAEELGLGWHRVTACRPFALVSHSASGVQDLGFELRCNARFAEVQDAARAAGNGEYQELIAVPEAAVASFLAMRAGRVVPAAALFLRALGMG